MADQRRWYGGMCRMLCIIDGVGAVESEESVWVFRAADWDDAKRRLLELGRTQDTEYENADGRRVRWTLATLERLDELDDELGDREVYSKISAIDPPDESVVIDQRFSPEVSNPRSSGV